MASILAGLAAGAMAGGAQAGIQEHQEEHKADLERQLMEQKAAVESRFQEATEQRHMNQAAAIRQTMAEQINPATEKILNAAGKTSMPQAAQPTAQAPKDYSGLLGTGQEPGAAAPTDYTAQATGVLAPPAGVPQTPQEAPKQLATPTEQLTARALAMVNNGWVSNPDDILKAAVTLNDTTQTAQARLDAAKTMGASREDVAAILAASRDYRTDNPTDQGYHNIVALGRQRDASRLAMQAAETRAANLFGQKNAGEKQRALDEAAAYKADMDRFNKQISDSLGGQGGTNPAPAPVAAKPQTDFKGFKIVP